MENKTITLDGISYDLSNFTDPVKQAVGIYDAIQADLQKAQYEVVKSQAALQNIGAQIAQAVRKELEAKKTEAETAEKTETAETPTVQ